MKTNRIPFSLEEYQGGKYKVVTKNGRKARIICTDFKSEQPIIAIVEEENDKESFSDFALDGKLWIGGRVSNTDLYLEETVFEDGDIVSFGYTSIGILKEIFSESHHSDYITLTEGTLDDMLDGWTNNNIRIATDKEIKRLFDSLKADGKRWNAEKKCVEDIKEECQFKPFDRVLVRDDNFSEWQADIFSNLCKVPEYPYVCVGGGWAQCILYEGNEELLGTNKTK